MEILESIAWARNTIEDRLMFGMEDSPLSAAYARELRASGVLTSCKKVIEGQQAKIGKLEAQNKELVEALQYYQSTHPLQLSEEDIKQLSENPNIWASGKKAREVLAKIKSED